MNTFIIFLTVLALVLLPMSLCLQALRALLIAIFTIYFSSDDLEAKNEKLRYLNDPKNKNNKYYMYINLIRAFMYTGNIIPIVTSTWIMTVLGIWCLGGN